MISPGNQGQRDHDRTVTYLRVRVTNGRQKAVPKPSQRCLKTGGCTTSWRCVLLLLRSRAKDEAKRRNNVVLIHMALGASLQGHAAWR